ncbi:MAG: metal-sulfur cluster assembly factor [Spiribacter salinus]|uniref:Metal-sulfur cluster assembly factor n=1 Tax=Spiribacter salinus TaxID=1335746 RepID=A0A540VV62_9GAMM|nr:MAG: metal-sulfur cluster assembly factor [Spiribacter salinus]
MSAPDIGGRVRDALREVRDPCMTAAGLNLSIVDLGLLRAVRVDADRIEVDVTFTEPGCPFSHRLLDDLHRVLDGLPEAERTRLNIVWSPPWTPADMTATARGQFDAARQQLDPKTTRTIPVKEISR